MLLPTVWPPPGVLSSAPYASFKTHLKCHLLCEASQLEIISPLAELPEFLLVPSFPLPPPSQRLNVTLK